MLKRGIYAPRGHSEDELIQRYIRDNWAKVVAGKQPIQMEVSISKEAAEKQNAVQNSLLEYLEGKRTVSVRVENSGTSKPDSSEARP
jgi:hypothetical protein